MTTPAQQKQGEQREYREHRELPNLYSLLICTDSARQLWPLVCEQTPAELVVHPETGASSLAHAIAAVKDRSARPLLIAAPSTIAVEVRAHIAEHHLLAGDEYRLLEEPWSRGTALTVALAAAQLKLLDPHALMLALPVSLGFVCDDRWDVLLTRAWQAASAERIVLVASQQPVWGTSLACLLRPGAELAGESGVHELRSSMLRLSSQSAPRARENGALWSAHIYVLRANLALSELHHARDAQAITRIAETARFFATLEVEHWASHDACELVRTLPDISFEEALFEATNRLVLASTSMEFRDLSTFAGLEQGLESDATDNRHRGTVELVGTRGVTVLADSGRTVEVRGLEDVVVIDTENGLLVARRSDIMPLS